MANPPSNKSSAARGASTTSSFWPVVEREPVLLAFVTALVAMNVFYRAALAATIYAGTSNVEILQPNKSPLAGLLKATWNDLLVVALMGLCYLAFKIQLRSRFPRMAAAKIFIALEIIFGAVVLTFLALLMRAYFQLLAQLGVALTLTLLQLAPEMFSRRDFFKMLTPADCFFLATPAAVFFLSLLCAKWLKRIYKPAGFALVVFCLVAQFFPVGGFFPSEVAQNPLAFLGQNAVQVKIFEWFSPQNRASRAASVSEAQWHSIRLMDTAFTDTDQISSPPADRQPLAPDGKPWNILIFVLESTGADYIFDTSRGNPTPMPFLKKMSREGLYLSNHFAAANLSARAAFSIFTGLYSPPSRATLCMKKDLSIPTLNDFLGPGYDYFIEHPTTPSDWFPEFLFLNNHLQELDTMNTMPAGHRAEATKEAINEMDCFDFLQSRLDRAQEPFLAVYWSFIAHYPYSDYGPDFRVRPDLNHLRDRYYNNLRVLDTQLQRIYEHLVQTGVADRTLFVFIGDHGEAFGQHEDWGHTFGSYCETYRAPAIFWQPKLIKPQVITFPTSHVDIVPTLLDIIGVSYNPARFQGDSVLRGVPNRKYIFTSDGFASYVTAISRDMKKVSICFEKNDTTAFDLVKDSGERTPLDANKFPDEVQAIFKFRKFQSALIPDYNQTILDHTNFLPPVSSPPVAGN